MKITEEELSICKLLPEHKLKVEDWVIYPYNEFDYTGLTQPSFITAVFDDGDVVVYDYEGDLGEIVESEKLIRIPSVDDLMSLDEWPKDTILCKKSQGERWYLIASLFPEGIRWTVRSNFYDGIISQAPTARLACLRAIRERLEEK
jgi:hypothetical protein